MATLLELDKAAATQSRTRSNLAALLIKSALDESADTNKEN